MRTIADLIDAQAMAAKRKKSYDLAVISDVLPDVLCNLDAVLGDLANQQMIVAEKLVGQQRRVLYLAADSAAALLLSYHLPDLINSLNEHLDDLSIDDIKIIHQMQN